MARMLFIAALIILFCPAQALAEKTDVLVFKNGDKLTGEVKSMEAGLLRFKTDAMGTVTIQWQYIEQVISSTNQSITTIDGRRFLGRLIAVEDSENIGIETSTSTIELPADRVFSAWPVETSFWEKSNLDIAVGLSYAKSTDITDFSLSADWEHREYAHLTEASLRSDITAQSELDDQNRLQFQLGRQYLKDDAKFRTIMASFESNESLGLDARIYLGGMYGKYLIRNNDRWFSLGGGLVATQEKYTAAGSQTNLEGVVNASFSFFKFSIPERSLDAKLTLFPSLTDSGRLRTDMRTTFKLELFEDFFWLMEMYYQGDNRPPIDAVQSDYGVTTSFGWSH